MTFIKQEERGRVEGKALNKKKQRNVSIIHNSPQALSHGSVSMRVLVVAGTGVPLTMVVSLQDIFLSHTLKIIIIK